MKPENLFKLRRIEATLRSTGKAAAIYRADDIATVIVEETGEAGLSAEELAAIRAGKPIDAIKMVRNRKATPGGALFGLKEAKEFVEDAGQKLGLFDPNPPPGGPRWKVPKR